MRWAHVLALITALICAALAAHSPGNARRSIGSIRGPLQPNAASQFAAQWTKETNFARINAKANEHEKLRLNGDPVTPIKSPEDKREYRAIELSSGLWALLIRDANSPTASCAMDVNVGHFSDPKGIPGLAHFLEHMLFLGTTQYPVEDEFFGFIEEHGGSSNAYTSTENTNYYFSIDYRYLQPALDRFASFFLSPLLTRSAVFREMTAVNAEHQKNLANDMWRLDQLMRSTANPAHPYSQFGTGSLQTLNQTGVDVYGELRRFYETYYSANLMKFAVIGRTETLDELEAMVKLSFRGLRNVNTPVPSWPAHPFRDSDLQLQLSAVPIKNGDELRLYFPMPQVHTLYPTRPASYLGHLIGHEGRNSLLDALKGLGWASGLSAGLDESASDFSLFAVTVKLTPAGLANVNNVTTMVFQYIEVIKSKGVQQWIFDEVKQLAEVSFRFAEDPEVSDYASNLRQYPPLDVLRAPTALLGSYNETEIRAFLSFMTPANMRMLVVSRSFTGHTTLKEKWYGTDYNIAPLPIELVAQWTSPSLSGVTMDIPKPNPFIPTDFTLHTPQNQTKEPVKIVSTNLSEGWYQHDAVFAVPKIVLRVAFTLPYTYASVKNFILMDLFSSLVTNQASPFSYDAGLAELSFTIGATTNGFLLTIKGFNDKWQPFADRILPYLLTNMLVVDEAGFNEVYTVAKQTIKNYDYQPPYRHAIDNWKDLVATPRYTAAQLTDAIDDITFADMRVFATSLYERLTMKFFGYGNMIETELRSVITTTESLLRETKPRIKPNDANEVRELRVVSIPRGASILYGSKAHVPTEDNGAIVASFQTSILSVNHSAIMNVLGTMIPHRFFTELRTKENLGYIVSASVQNMRGVGYLFFIVQSPRVVGDPMFLDSRIENFLVNTLENDLSTMTDTQFQDLIASVKQEIEQDPATFFDQADRYWAQVSQDPAQLLGDKAILPVLDGLTKQDIINYCKYYLFSPTTRRKVVAMEFAGQATSPSWLTPSDDTIVQAQVNLTNNGPIYSVIYNKSKFKNNNNLFPVLDATYVNYTDESTREWQAKITQHSTVEIITSYVTKTSVTVVLGAVIVFALLVLVAVFAVVGARYIKRRRVNKELNWTPLDDLTPAKDIWE